MLRHHWRFLPPTISYEYICTYTLYTRNPVQPQCTQILQYILCGSFWIFLALWGSVGPFWLSYWIWCLRAEKTHRPPDRWSRDLIKVSTFSKKPCGLAKPQPLLGTRWHHHTVGTNSHALRAASQEHRRYRYHTSYHSDCKLSRFVICKLPWLLPKSPYCIFYPARLLCCTSRDFRFFACACNLGLQCRRGPHSMWNALLGGFISLEAASSLKFENKEMLHYHTHARSNPNISGTLKAP